MTHAIRAHCSGHRSGNLIRHSPERSLRRTVVRRYKSGRRDICVQLQHANPRTVHPRSDRGQPRVLQPEPKLPRARGQSAQGQAKTISSILRPRFIPDRRLFDQRAAVELAVRKDSDRFVKQGAYGALQARLRRQSGKLAEIPTVVLSAFDRSTRLLPFLFYDMLMFPAGAGAIANALNQAGFARTRAVFQLWNPNFKPSRARFDGRAIEMLLISSMHINSQRAYDAISEAWSLDAERPLVIGVGPKAIYEPYHFWPEPGKRNPTAPDVAVTGEQYVLLE